MLRLIFMYLPQLRHGTSNYSNGHLFSTSPSRPISKLSDFTEKPSFTVSYLQNSCGLPLNAAILAAKKIHIKTADNPDSVLNLLRTQGFTQTQIRSLISKRPALLLSDLCNTLKPNMDLFGSLGFSGTSLVKMINKDPRVLETDASIFVKYFKDHAFSEKQIANLTLKRPTLYLYNAQNIFKPKFEYFYSLGFSNLEVAKILSEEPYILERSLEFQIIPCIKELKRILGTNENVLKVIRACYRILECNVEELLEPNISMMLSRGVPQALVMKMFLMEPKSLLLKADRLSEILNETVKLGFDPNKFIFVLAIRCLALLSRTLWERKVEAYGSFGLSTDEIYSAFRLQPMFMIVSEKKIRKSMCFFINKLKLNPSMISKNPNLLLLSLESRIIPRCSVLQILMSKGLIKGDISLTYALRMTEKLYVEKFVSRFQDEVPDVVRAHQGMLEFQGFLH